MLFTSSVAKKITQRNTIYLSIRGMLILNNSARSRLRILPLRVSVRGVTHIKWQVEQSVCTLKYSIQTRSLLKRLRLNKAKRYFTVTERTTPGTQYHFRLLFLQREKTFPPPNNSATRFDQIAANLMESLLLFCSPFNKEKPGIRIHVVIWNLRTLLYYFPAEK